MLKSLLVALFLGILLAQPARANPPRAVLLAQAGTDHIEFGYTNVYAVTKSSDVSRRRNGWVEFDGTSFTPTLVRFTTIIVSKRRERSQLMETPVLVLMPGDTVTVLYDAAHNDFRFRGRHQAELDFCVSLWRGSLSLGMQANKQAEVVDEDSTVTYMPVKRVRPQPLDQCLRTWSQLRREGETRLAQLRRTPGIRPEVAASLARHIRLHLFSQLLRPLMPWSRRDTLRTPPPAYRDTVAAQLRGVLAMQALPAAAAEGLGFALGSYVEYQCVLARQYPTVGARYKQAKQWLSGFHRAWVCYLILDEGRDRHQNITYYLQDYARWVKPHDELLKVLRGGPPVPLRSYPHAAFSDSLATPAGLPRHLTDVLAAYQGKVVLLDLWASWCAPCREELPRSVAMARRYGRRGLVVLYLSIDADPADWQKALRKLSAEVRLHYRFLRPNASAFRQEFDVRSVPRYLLIDRSGTVRYPDALRPSDARFGAVVEELLGAAGAGPPGAGSRAAPH